MNLVINESQPLWEYLRCAEKPVVLYGKMCIRDRLYAFGNQTYGWGQQYLLSIMPVSYTHLDVYKRQPIHSR